MSSLDLLPSGDSVSWTVRSPGSSEGPPAREIFDAIDEVARGRGFLIRHREPDHRIFVNVSDRSYVGRIKEFSSRASAEARRGSRMPFNRPVIMDPRLARALVNLSGLPPGDSVLDPFLGPAGLAIEAADMGLKVLGVEKDPAIFRGALKNIEEMGLGDMIIARNGDSKRFMSYEWSAELAPFDGIITDPPFGRSAATHGDETGKLLGDVLDEVSGLILKGGPLVVDAPSREHLLDIPDFELRKELSLRVHRSLTRHIGVLERK